MYNSTRHAFHTKGHTKTAIVFQSTNRIFIFGLIDISRGNDIGRNTNKPIKSQGHPEQSRTFKFDRSTLFIFRPIHGGLTLELKSCETVLLP